MDIAVLLLSMCLFFAVGMPIAFALALSALVGALWIDLPVAAVMQQLSSGVGKVSMLTVPFFVLAGAIMAEGGMARRLVDFAAVVVGFTRIRGGLSQVNILATTIMSGISGSSVADTSAIGPVMIPQAQDAGVKIAIEVVWNNFITKPEQMIQYVDQFDTPTVGTYFDISNMIKFGVPPADWIRALGPRLLKFDFKGYSKSKGWCGIGEGDENWPDVLKALKEVNYQGEFATAEVDGGGAKALKDISQRMDRILGLA